MILSPMIVDLCSGSGSSTGIWETMGYDVLRFDIVAPDKVPTIPADLSDPNETTEVISQIKDHLTEGERPLLIWASPPCTEYSDAHPRRYLSEWIPDTRIWKNCLRIIKELDPEYWVIENVRGAIFTWGKPTQRCGPYYLWGKFPKFNIPEKVPGKNLSQYTNKIDQARESAKIPYVVSNGLYRSITLQKKLLPPEF